MVEKERWQCADDLSPKEIAERVEEVGLSKAQMSALSLVVLSIFAGAFIALGADFFVIVTTNSGLSFGLEQFIGGLAFCLGLILVVIAGAELFTGNNLMVVSLLSRKISLLKLGRNWVIVYLGNLAGSLAIVFLVYLAGQFVSSNYEVGARALRIAAFKVSLPFWNLFFRGILCNMLVCLAVWLTYGARTVLGKIVAIIFPISAFVAAGFEHSVANMFFIPMGMLMASEPAIVTASGLAAETVAKVNLGGFIYNLIPVTIGNIIGGGLFVGFMYWLAHLKNNK